MKKQEKGFTLIELIVVIAILGILVAVAIPKYVDLTEKANKAHDQGLLGGLRTATVLLYGSNIVGGSAYTNPYGTYWPTQGTVVAQMTDPVAATNWLWATNTSYNPTSGTWIVIGPGGVSL